MNVFQPYALLLARMLLSGVFLFSAISKLYRDPQDLKAVAGLHVPYPGLMLLIVGICEIIGVVMLTLGAGARIAAVLLSLFIIFVTLAFLRFWTMSASDARFAIKNAFSAIWA